MTNNDKEGCLQAVLLGIVVVFIVAGVLCWHWYTAGVQAEVYRRQGVNMTQWEVFMGAKPVERYVVDPKEKGKQ